MSEAGDYVLDTSAVLALRGDEPGADRVENLLRMAARGRTQILLSFMTRMELLYRVGRDEGAEVAAAAIRVLDVTAIRWISCDDDVLEEASRIKAGSGISVADAWIAATAATSQRGARVQRSRVPPPEARGAAIDERVLLHAGGRRSALLLSARSAP